MPDRIFAAGSPALAFTDRVIRAGVKDYADLVEIARLGGLIDPGKTGGLLEEAQRTPFRADEVLAEARILARVIQRIFAGLAAGAGPDSADIDFLNGSLGRAMAHLALAPLAPGGPGGNEPGFLWTWGGNGGNGGDALDAMLWPVVRDAAELLIGQDPARIRLCQGANCERLFLDSSKAGRRRWCCMATCGNRAKARRHAQRHAQRRNRSL